MKRIYILVFFIAFVACKKSGIDATMQQDVAYLASDELEGRATGTKGETLASDYISERYKHIGLTPKGTNGYLQGYSFTPKKDPHSQAEFSEEKTEKTINSNNVIGFIDNQAENTIVIGAHYDHLGYGEQGSLHRGEKAVHNGADDNASGIAVMLDLAERLKAQKGANNYLFIAFSGEELGLLGSNYFVKNPTIDLKKVNYMINMDMVGRLKEDKLAVYGVGTSPFFKQTLTASNEGFNLVEKESGVGPSDHTSFYINDIPVLHFFTGQHEDYHKPTDDEEKLNYKGMQRVADYLMAIINDLDDNGKLTFKKTKNESEQAPRFKVTLGVIPDYLFEGKGMRIDGVSEGKPAQKAGLQKGDIVVGLGDLTIDSMMSYMKALSKFEKGQTTTVKVDRKGTIVSSKVTF